MLIASIGDLWANPSYQVERVLFWGLGSFDGLVKLLIGTASYDYEFLLGRRTRFLPKSEYAMCSKYYRSKMEFIFYGVYGMALPQLNRFLALGTPSQLRPLCFIWVLRKDAIINSTFSNYLTAVRTSYDRGPWQILGIELGKSVLLLVKIEARPHRS